VAEGQIGYAKPVARDRRKGVISRPSRKRALGQSWDSQIVTWRCANFARASRAGCRAAKTEPRAAFAAYHSQERARRIKLKNGATITWPVELISGLKGARPKDLRGVEVLGHGNSAQVHL
jgi:hypothetical protein